VQGQGGFGRPGGPEGRNRSSGNGGKQAGIEAVIEVFGQKMRGLFVSAGGLKPPAQVTKPAEAG